VHPAIREDFTENTMRVTFLDVALQPECKVGGDVPVRGAKPRVKSLQ
jgi:hypothetical protein